MRRMSVKYRGIALGLAAVTGLSLSAAWPRTAQAAGEQIHYIANENLAPGIHYSEEDIQGYGATGDRRIRVNHLSVDPTAEGISFNSARAENTINARENILNQAMRDVYQGVNVVASINADPYDMDYGLNCGIQVRNGSIVVSQPNNQYTTDTPAFFVDGSGTPHIDALRAAADITVGEDYAQTVTSINRNMFGSWYTDDPNKITSDTLRVYTSRITGNGTMTHYRTEGMPEKQAYALIQLDGFDGDIYAGTEYTGTVTAVYEADGFDIPADSVVLAGYAGDADGVAALEPGETVDFTGHLYTGAFSEDESGHLVERGELCDDVTAAVNGFHLLAKDGQVNTPVVDGQGTDVNSRTVIGITADGKVEILCVNKPGANFSSELTSGTTFREITDYMMNELGCVDVLNMDGGGSTEMTARRAGADSLATVSYPSDGGSRLVSNSLLIISNAPRTTEVAQVLVDEDVNLYPGSETDFSVRLTDASGSSLDASGYQVAWSAQYGTIDENGHYTAPAEECDDVVTAEVAGVSGTARVSVIGADHVQSISISGGDSLALDQGAVYQFGFTAYDAGQQSIVISPSLADWKIEGDEIGTLTEDGLLTVTAESGTAEVTAEFMGQTFSTTVVVGLKEQIIDNFEGDDTAYHISSRYIYPNHPEYRGSDGSEMVGAETDPSMVKNGSQSLYWVYDTKDWTRATNGTLYVYPDWDAAHEDLGWTAEEQQGLMDQYRAKARPKKFGLWIYSGDENNDGVSDNYNCMMTAQFYANDGTWVDENGTTHYDGADGGEIQGKSIKITPDEHMDWIGWKYFEFDVPEDWPMPITFNYLWMSNIYKGADQQDYKTTVMLDDLKWIYSDEEQDLEGPSFSGTQPSGGGLYSDTLEFSTVISDASGVDADSVSVTVNDEAVTDYRFDQTTGQLSFIRSGLENGQSYRVIVKAKDVHGNESVPYVDETYTVDLSPDTEAPRLSNVTPSSESQASVKIPSPRIGFRLQDPKSGVNTNSLKVTLDGREIRNVYLDEETGWGYAQPDFELDEGTVSAELTIDVSDNDGNAMETYRDTVSVSLIPQPADPENYDITVIPDTQGNAYSDMIYPRAASEDSGLVIQLGDIVDGVNTAEFEEGKNWIEGTGKPYLIAAGNHEGGDMNLDLFNEYFGSPTYTFDYGQTRIIVLNSAFNQSVTASDPTQYRYLEEMLESNTLPNVYVINHVVTEDHFNTQHNMTAEECAQFEGVMGAYKEANPDVNVNVISGHLHTLESWERQGVNYIIGGNAAGKGYVTAEEGNLLGYGTIHVQNGEAAYEFKPLLTEIYLRNAAMQDGTLHLAKGGSAQIDVYGDFREKASVDSYMTQINDDALVDITWESSDPEIASVSDTGVVTMQGEGTAEIRAFCGERSASFTVVSQDMSQVSITKLELRLDGPVGYGDTVTPLVTAMDVYGTVITMNNQEIAFASANGMLQPQEDGTLLAVRTGDDVITAEYRGKTAECEISVQALEIGGIINPERIEAEAGTAFEELPLPEKVGITYKTRAAEEVSVNWEAGKYQADVPGVYTLYGELVLEEGMTNPDGLMAEIQVTVKENASETPDPEPTEEPDITPEPTLPGGQDGNQNGGDQTGGAQNGGSQNGSLTADPAPGQSQNGSPDTGDPANMALWCGVAVAGGIGMTMLIVSFRKKAKS